MSDHPNVRIWFHEEERLESSAEGRQRQCRRNLRLQVVPQLSASNRKCLASDSGEMNQLNEAVAAGRAKPSATWKVGNVSDRAKVRRRTAVEHLVHQEATLDLMHSHAASKGWWGHQRHGHSNASWKSLLLFSRVLFAEKCSRGGIT